MTPGPTRAGVSGSLASYTTLRLGGPAGRILEVRDESALIAALTDGDAAGEELLLLGGGSNVVVADDGFAGTVLLVRTAGIVRTGNVLTVAAGTTWDAVVDYAVTHDLAGVECLAGIPGSTGATPIQNVGAYGQDVSQTIASVRVFDRQCRNVTELHATDCDFSYRHSRFKREPGRFAVLAVTFRLEDSTWSKPIAYRELAEKLDVGIGERAPLAAVRAAVVELRAAKGMMIDPADPDTRSVGSFFTNPIVADDRVGDLPVPAPAWPQPGRRVKLSAAWLVENAGFSRGSGNAGARISSKHTLALTAIGDGTTEDLLCLAAAIQAGVAARFGVSLTPEPTLVGVRL